MLAAAQAAKKSQITDVLGAYALAAAQAAKKDRLLADLARSGLAAAQAAKKCPHLTLGR